MPPLRTGTLAASAALVLATPWLAPAQTGLVMEQKTKYNIARLGGGELKQTTMILGNDRQKTVTEGKIRILLLNRDASGTEIVRLDENQVYQIDDRRKQYEVLTIPNMRERMQQMQQEAEAAAKNAEANEPQARQQQEQDVRMWVEVVEQLHRTGERKTINGFNTEQLVLKMIVMGEDTRTKETSPVFHLAADLWMDYDQQKASEATYAFARAYAERLGIDPQMEPQMAGNPYAQWIKEMGKEIEKLDGAPILTNLVIEAEAPPQEQAAAERREASRSSDPVGAAIGGLMRRATRSREEPAPNPAASGRPLLFSLSSEVLSISTTPPSASEFEVPAGYRRK